MKRGRKSQDVLTLDRRVSLKASFDSGEVGILNPVTDEICTFHEVLKRPNDIIDHSPKLGSGIYGEIKAIKDENGNDVAVMKISGVIPDLINCNYSPFNSSQTEPRILNFLWDNLVATGVTPHIIAPYGTHDIVNSVTTNQLKKYAEMEKSLVYFMEKASAKTIRDFLGYTSKLHFDFYCKVLLFQVCHTLGAIFLRWPKFRHSDLKDDNVLLNHCNDTGCTRYTIYGRTFYVPCIGVTALLSDFDFACIAGSQFDNFKVIELSWDLPTYSINARENQYADLYTLVQYIRVSFREKMSDEFKEQLDELYGTFQRSTKNSYHIMPGEVYPTVKQLLLDSDLFDDFKHPRGVIHASYCADIVSPLKMEPLPVSQGDYRHCPIFRSRHPQQKVVNASLQFFSKLRAHQNAHDEDEGDAYSEPIAMRLLDWVRGAYVHLGKETEEFDIPVHDLPQEDCDECMVLIESIAQRFIEMFHVSVRWWCAVYSCAFVDACFELALIPKGQRCWKLEDWCYYWQECGETIYTPTQMLHFALQWEWLVR